MPHISDYEEARTYLLGAVNETVSRRVRGRLDRMRILLRRLGDPQTAYPTIQIGGTSGKGSTASMVAAALTASGKRTGLHVKPHINSMTERAQIDGVNVAEARFAEVLDGMMAAIHETSEEIGDPSYYEILLALAFSYFAQEHVDVGVIEVGLGGTLDGTNVLVPRLCVITNVGLDHTDVLGETIEEIAGDKAGIAKVGIPLVSDAREPKARETIARRCEEIGAPVIFVEDVATIESRSEQHSPNLFSVTTARATYHLALPLLGSFQQRNAATAIVALEQLGEDLRPRVVDVERGLSRLSIPGRMEYHPGYPGIVFDIAHNADKARGLAAALTENFPEKRFMFVIAVSQGKDADNMLLPLLELPGSFVFTSFSAAGREAIRPQRLVNIAELHGRTSRAIEDPIEAFAQVRRSTGDDAIVVVTGSTYVVSILHEWWTDDQFTRSRR